MKDKQKRAKVIALFLAVILVIVLVFGCVRGTDHLQVDVSDGIEQIDLDTIRLEDSGVEVSFSDVLLSEHKESRKLIVSEQEGTVSITLEKKLIKVLDIEALEKTQTVS